MGRPPLERERRRALQLARRHPGWSLARIAERTGAGKTTVHGWLAEAGLAPKSPRVRRGDGARGQAVALVCGHRGVPPYQRVQSEGWCWTCRAYVPLGRPARREHEQAQELIRLMREPSPLPPDTPPEQHELDLPWQERRVSTVAAQLREWLRYGPLPTGERERIEEILRRSGLDREAIEGTLAELDRQELDGRAPSEARGDPTARMAPADERDL